MRRKIIKWVLYMILTILLFAFQTSAGNRITVFGEAADLLPFLIASAAVMEGYKGAAWIAFLAGVLCDVTFTHEPVFYCALYFLSACVCSIVTDYYLKKSFLTSLLWGTVIFIVKAVFRSVVLNISMPGLGMFVVLSDEVISLAFSAVLSWIVYIPVKYISRISETEPLKFEGVSLRRRPSETDITHRKRKYRIMKDSSMTRQEEHFWSNIFK